jgi:hypothetical protein
MMCEKTGSGFLLVDDGNGTSAGRSRHPRSPSLDRIDRTKGYTADNVQVVCWQYNIAKGELDDANFVRFCRRVVETADKA